jgi:hypothetical protein
MIIAIAGGCIVGGCIVGGHMVFGGASRRSGQLIDSYVNANEIIVGYWQARRLGGHKASYLTKLLSSHLTVPLQPRIQPCHLFGLLVHDHGYNASTPGEPRAGGISIR